MWTNVWNNIWDHLSVKGLPWLSYHAQQWNTVWLWCLSCKLLLKAPWLLSRAVSLQLLCISTSVKFCCTYFCSFTKNVKTWQSSRWSLTFIQGLLMSMSKTTMYFLCTHYMAKPSYFLWDFPLLHYFLAREHRLLLYAWLWEDRAYRFEFNPFLAEWYWTLHSSLWAWFPCRRDRGDESKIARRVLTNNSNCEAGTFKSNLIVAWFCPNIHACVNPIP